MCVCFGSINNPLKVVNTLRVLNDAGVLDMQETDRKLRRTLEEAACDHSGAMTPYGKVVQNMSVPGLDEPLEFVDPRAYTRYLSTLNESFGDIFNKLPSKECTVILYIDELIPGNPFRPDKARKAQCVYWAVLQWPQWLISRSAIWPPLTLIRSDRVENVSGGISGLFSALLSIFTKKLNVQIIVHGTDRLSLCLVYGGLMADEKALKEVFDYKGAGGLKACMDCPTVINSRRLEDIPRGAQSMHTTCSLEGLQQSTNELIWNMADDLQNLVDRGRPYKEKEKQLGLKYNQFGLLYQNHLRSVHYPIDHYIRDWMHTMVSGGVANTQMALIGNAIKSLGIPTDLLQKFSLEIVLPKQHGKVSPAWLDKERFKSEDGEAYNFTSFASYMMSIVPIVLCFLEDIVMPIVKEDMAWSKHFRCWELLVDILGILSSGADYALQHLELLEKWVVEHHKLYLELYDLLSVKPKWHHMLHLAKLYARLNKIISCFVTERKHRAVKRRALYIFRHYEHTTLTSIINDQCEQIIEGHSLFKESFLVSPHEVGGASFLQKSTRAVFKCGEVVFDDIVYIAGGVIARVVCFWEMSHESQGIFVQCNVCKPIAGNKYQYKDSDDVEFFPELSIVGPVSYRPMPYGMRVIFPFKAKFR